MRLRTRPLLQRLAALLATAQLVAYAVAPVIEAQVERAPGPVSVEEGHSTHCVSVHQAATCLACQLVVTRARAAQPGRVPVLNATHAPSPGAVPLARASRAPPRFPSTRAPPALAA